MSEKENLGPGVREIVELLENGETTINLREVKPGDKLYIKIGEKEEDLLDFTIITPAKKDMTGATDSARAWLPGWKLGSSLKKKKHVKILIGGSCTYNSGAPFGMTMFSMGRLTQGRSMVIWCEEKGYEDQALIFKSGIISMTLVHEN